MMRPIVATRVGALLLSCAGASRAWGDDPSSTAGLPVTLPPPIEAPSSRDVGPVLVVPGAPTSAVPRPRQGAPAVEPGPPVIGGELPALIGPAEMPEPGIVGPARRDGPSPTGRVELPLDLETVPDSVEPETPRIRPTPRREPLPLIRRGPRLFGRFAQPAPSAGRGPTSARGAIPDEPKSDPAADAALKRRIERQVRDTLGDQVRSVEVRVVGRNVAIRAKASRFWQRRGVRRTLESLPGLAKYRTSVEVID